MSKRGQKRAIDALKQHKAEQEEQLHNNIVSALTRLRNNEAIHVKLKPFKKISVTDLAAESGVSRGSLYGNHKALLIQLEKINEKRGGVNQARKKRSEEKERAAATLSQLVIDKELLAQENYRLHEENKRLLSQNDALLTQLGGASNVSNINRLKKN